MGEDKRKIYGIYGIYEILKEVKEYVKQARDRAEAKHDAYGDYYLDHGQYEIMEETRKLMEKIEKMAEVFVVTIDNKQKFAAFNREERLVLYNALCAYTKSCSLVDERALRLGASPGSDYDVADRLWDELRHEGMGPKWKK